MSVKLRVDLSENYLEEEALGGWGGGGGGGGAVEQWRGLGRKDILG